MKGFTFFCVLLLLAINSVATAQTTIENVKHFVDSIYAANPQAVGFMLHIEAPKRHLSWSYAVGYANRDTKQKLSTGDPVLIASNTKPYVAAAILRLAEQHKLNIHHPVKTLLSPQTEKLLSAAGYQTDSITVRHLLSHTSGIRDYVDEGYFKFVGEHKKHAWTRNEQIERATQLGKPLSKPGEAFKYADVNYLLLTEIIEQVTRQPFYTAMRKLLDYKKHQLNATWFAKLEQSPLKVKPRAHQYWDEFGWDTYNLDPSWDLYGGGGMVATAADMAMFFQLLFNNKVIHDGKILSMMREDVPPNLDINYCLGIRKIKYAGLPGYNHGGGLGTDVIYIPELNATVAIATLEAQHRPLAVEISKEIVRQLHQSK